MTPTPNNEALAALTPAEMQAAIQEGLRIWGNSIGGTEEEEVANAVQRAILAKLSSGQAASAVPTLRERLQQRCSDWGVYWRASDAHGVDLSHEQALDLLRDALGVEVEIATPAAPAQPREADPELPSMWEQADFTGGETDGSTPPAPRAPSIEPAEPVARFLKLGESIATDKLVFVELLGAHVPDAKLYYAAPASAGVEEFPLPEPDVSSRVSDSTMRSYEVKTYSASAVRDVLRSYSTSLGLQARTEGEQA